MHIYIYVYIYIYIYIYNHCAPRLEQRRHALRKRDHVAHQPIHGRARPPLARIERRKGEGVSLQNEKQ